jgi:hypothetical protein
MPLIKSKSKQAFKHNIEAEMSAGKPQDQALAVAYSMRRKKKMAKGGIVNESAATERRPMPQERDKDAAQVSQNSSMKPLSQDKWTDQPTVQQARKPSVTALSRPKIAGSGVFTVRDRDRIKDEEELESSASVNDGAQEQPPKRDDEMGANRQGPESKDLKLKMMAEGGMARSEDPDLAKCVKGPDKGYGAIIQCNAEGGMVEEEEGIEHDASIAAAIMAKRKRMADGGMVDLDLNAMEQPNDFDELNEAALKENYDEDMHDVSQPMDSNEHGDEIDSDDHDMVSIIRRKMKLKSPMVR